MTRFLTKMALTLAALTCVTTAQAADNRGETRRNRGESIADYHTRFGTKFDHGVFYAGRDHHHWSSRYFDERFGCHLYMCPSTKVYYYWCERDVRFYPISYCPYDTYAFGTKCVFEGCPVVFPKNPPPYEKNPGSWNTIHPIPSPKPLRPIEPIQLKGPFPSGLVPPAKLPPELGHGPVVPPTKLPPELGHGPVVSPVKEQPRQATTAHRK